jgi:predicted regulator of Ras-like GTPase activity (Roadblock/LC7/MglB family)
MANVPDTLDGLMSIDGALGAALVDSTSGMLLGKAGTGIDLEVAAAGNTEVMRAYQTTFKSLALKDAIDDILITLSTQYHIIRPIASIPEVFIYLVLESKRANLALARLKVKEADKQLEL